MKRWIYAAAMVVAVGVSSPALAQDAHVGTWKLNPALSKSEPASSNPAPQSVTRTYEMFGDGLKFTSDTVGADGKHTMSTYSAHFDGKEYPLTGNANGDAISLKKIDNNTFESTIKKANKITSVGKNTVSKDGKTMTYKAEGKNAQGQSTTTLQVFTKQ